MIAVFLLTLPLITALPTGDDFNLGLPTQVSLDVLNSLKTAEKIDLFTALIIQQAPFPKLSGVENLTDHQQAAKITAQTWRSHVRSKLFSVNDAILAFSYEFDAFYDSLVEYADKLGTKESKDVFVACLEELSTTIRQQHNDSVRASQTLTEFHHRMMQHKGIINGDHDHIIRTASGSKTEAQDIERRIDAIDEVIRKKEKELDENSEVLKTWSFIPIIGQIVQLSVSSSWRNGATDALRQKLEERKQLIIELHSINSRIALADVIARDVVTLVSQLQIVVNATENLNKAWSQLEIDYNNVKKAVIGVEGLVAPRKATIAVIVKNKLAYAKNQWHSLAETANIIKMHHLIPQSRYN